MCARSKSGLRASDRSETFRRVFVGIFGHNFFAALEMKFVIAEVNRLIGFADQMHLDASRFGVVDRAMLPVIEIEVRAEFAIRSRQQDSD